MATKGKSKKGKVSKVIEIIKRRGQADRVEVKNGKAEPEPQPQPMKADFKPKSQFVRITPRMPKLR